MSCSLHGIELPKPKPVRVNGIEVSRGEISREAQYYPAQKPIDAWQSAAKALAIRSLLLDEARRLSIASEPLSQDGRTETTEEAVIRGLFEQEVKTPQPDKEVCRRYYERNRARFRSATIYEAAHILLAADRRDAEGYGRAKELADTVATELRAHPEKFESFAALHSTCPSAAHGGNLGQLVAGQTTPEFEAALFALVPGTISGGVESRYGVHIIRLDRRIEGAELPFEAVQERIADYLYDAVQRRAAAQYIARLVAKANIEGIALEGPEAHRVS